METINVGYVAGRLLETNPAVTFDMIKEAESLIVKEVGDVYIEKSRDDYLVMPSCIRRGEGENQGALFLSKHLDRLNLRDMLHLDGSHDRGLVRELEELDFSGIRCKEYFSDRDILPNYKIGGKDFYERKSGECFYLAKDVFRVLPTEYDTINGIERDELLAGIAYASIVSGEIESVKFWLNEGTRKAVDFNLNARPIR